MAKETYKACAYIEKEGSGDKELPALHIRHYI